MWQWDALVKKHADKAEWKIFIKAHQEITDEVNDGGNDSTSASLPPASPAHTAASPPQDGALDALPSVFFFSSVSVCLCFRVCVVLSLFFRALFFFLCFLVLF